MWLELLGLLACGGAPTVAPEPVPPEPAPLDVDVHLTIDDAPWQIERGVAETLPKEALVAWNAQLRHELGARGVPVSVFFNCSRLTEGDGIVEAWAAAGAIVGNHTDHHVRLPQMEVADWLADTAVCSTVLEGRTGERPTWFRYPYLAYGRDRPQTEAATAGLSALGLRSAPITVATTEWMYAFAYRRARARGQPEVQAEIVAEWLDHMDRALEFGIELAAAHPGRSVPQTVLVHDNELVSEHIGELIDRWTARGVRWVDLPTAMADPVFSAPIAYVGPAGISWLQRTTPVNERPEYWFAVAEGAIVDKWGPMPAKDAPVAERVGLPR